MTITPITLPAYKTAPPIGGGTLAWLWFFLKPFQIDYFTIFFINLARQSFFKAHPVILGLFVGWAADGTFKQHPELTFYAPGAYVLAMAFAFILLFAVIPIAGRAMDKASKTCALFAFQHYLSLPESWHENRASGEKLQRLLKGRESIFYLLEEGLWQIIQFPAAIVSIIGSIIFLQASLIYAFLFLGLILSYIWLSSFTGKWMQRRYAHFYETQENVVGGVYEFLASTSTVRFFNLAHHILGKAGGLEGINHVSRKKVFFTSAKRWVVMDCLALLWIFTIMSLATHDFINGTLPLAGYSTLLFLTLTIWWELENFAMIFVQLLGHWEGFKRLTEVLNQKPAIMDSPNAHDFKSDKVSIDFSNIHFHYTEEKTIIRDFSLKIEAGEKIGLIGPSGAGKSTVIKLLMRFYDPNEGNVRLNNDNLRAITRTSLQNHIAVIPQDVVLFNHSLIENIRYGHLEASDEEIFEAARKANAHEFILDLPAGYQTFVGERGVKLSGGQRQRIAIARAILKNAPVLILDEATSALDSESEKLIQDSLKDLMQGKTVIAIAHRLSTIAHLDRLIVMDAGRITEEGSHSALLAKGKLYARLWSMQSGGFLQE